MFSRLLASLVLALPVAAQCPRWSSLQSVPDPAVVPHALAVFDDGSGPQLFAGGAFASFHGIPTQSCARFDGTTWRAASIPTGQELWTLRVLDLGAGPELFAGGGGLYRWSPAGWTTLSTAGGQLRDLAVFDSGAGPELYAVAWNFPGGTLLRWTGAAWSVVASSMGVLDRLTTFDDGTGPALYVGGATTTALGQPTGLLLRWNGTSLTTPAAQPGFPVYVLRGFDLGAGPELIAAGATTPSGAQSEGVVAAYRGGAWVELGAHLTDLGYSGGYVMDLELFDDQVNGPSLYAFGVFTLVTPLLVCHGVARWDGAAWRQLGTGIGGGTLTDVVAAAVLPRAGAPSDLAIFGDFTSVGGLAAQGLAAWLACNGPGAGFCAGDGLDPAVHTGCPCGNRGAPGHGCANSVHADGGVLDASGAPHNDDVLLHAGALPARGTCLFVKTNGTVPGGFQAGDGILCVGSSLVVLGLQPTSGGNSFYPLSGQPTVSQGGGNVVGSGQLAYYQVLYRNAAAAFCPPESLNVTNGYVIAW